MSTDEIVAAIHAEISQGRLEIGKIYKHPGSGQLIRITSGAYFIGDRVSNHWHWSYVNDDGTDTGVVGHGYGWHDVEVIHYSDRRKKE